MDSLAAFRFRVTAMCLLASCWFMDGMACAQDEQSPLIRAHAHNDYLHDRPLLDALDNGFCSVEADIFLVDGKLLVAHSRFELAVENTLKRLYLEPLRLRVKQNGGRVYRNGPVFSLMIDIKADGESAYRALAKLLAQYDDVFSCVKHGRIQDGAVTAIISGDRATDVISADDVRYAGIDGRLTDLQSKEPAHLMPLISDNWRRHFTWTGVGPFPMAEREKLQRIVQQAHSHGRRVRFWATPDNLNMWKTLNDAEVDLINTDDLPGLSSFLRTQ